MKYIADSAELTSVANAIRTKGGTSDALEFPDGFVSAINDISAGGTDVSDTTATASDVLNGKYFYTANGTKTEGSIASKTSSDMTASTLTVTAPAGHYASDGVKTLSDANLTAGNIKKNVSIFGVTGSYEGSGGGLVYETGTYTPAANIAIPQIYFTNTHSNIPMLIIMADTTASASGTTYTNYSFLYGSFSELVGTKVPSASDSGRYGLAGYVYINNGNPSQTVSGITREQGSSSASYQDYWVSNEWFKPSSNSTDRYWTAGTTYKWIAVWKPTT